MKLRYTGSLPTTFMTPGREVQPDEEFDVQDEDAGGYLAREDIEQVPGKKSRTRAASASDSPPDDVTPAAQAPDEKTN